MFWKRSSHHRKPFPKLISSVFSAKAYENRPKFKKLFCSGVRKTSTGRLCLRVLLGVSLSSPEQVLGRTFIRAYGEASGFFILEVFCICYAHLSKLRQSFKTIKIVIVLTPNTKTTILCFAKTITTKQGKHRNE